MLIASFVFFLLLFIGVGIWASRGQDHTDSDYLIAGRSTPPLLTAFSAAATTNSGFMFIGIMAFVYLQGLHAIWIVMGFVFGDFLMSFMVYPRVWHEANARKTLTYPELLAHWGGKNHPYVRIFAAFLTVLLLGLYAAAQLQAGGKALSVMLNWNIGLSALIGGLIILSYCLVGGLRSSIWTDTVQAVVMVLSMLLLMVYAVLQTGGASEFIAAADKISPTYLDLFPSNLPFFDPVSASMLFILGWVFGGIGVIGQPHIMIRYMAMRSPEEMTKIRIYNYSWNLIFNLLAIGVGMAARILLTEQAGFDAELSLPTLSLQLMPAVLAGAMLAGVFAATLSTADSQILSCSAALTHDFSRGEPHPAFRTDEIATALVTLFVILIASFGNYIAIGGFSVFSLVLLAWSGLAASFGPVMIIYVLGGRPKQGTILVMMLISLLTVLAWQQFAVEQVIYSVFPGFIAGFFVYTIDLALRSGDTAPDK